MSCCAIDFCESRDVLDKVLERLKERVKAGVHVQNDEPDGAFYDVAEAFDNYRETYVQGGDVDDALIDVATAAVLHVRKGKG